VVFCECSYGGAILKRNSRGRVVDVLGPKADRGEASAHDNEQSDPC
jgi:hypothetical protein